MLRRPKMARARKWIQSPYPRFLVGLLFPTLLGWTFLYSAGTMPHGAEGEVVVVEVAKGDSFIKVARTLGDQGVISNTTLFTLWARLWGLDRKLGWGQYRFELPLSSREVLNRLVQGKGAFRRLTIPEGFTVKEIAEQLEKNGISNKERFLAHAANAEALSELGLAGTGAEGYLFPDTYHFSPATAEAEILNTAGAGNDSA